MLSVVVEPNPPYRITELVTPSMPKSKNSKKIDNAAIAKELDKFLKKLAEADVFSGVVLVAHKGKPFYEKAFGQANKDFKVPNRIDTKFNLGSMNKMFTAVAIAQLVEAGKLSFDDPVSRFLPDFPNQEDAKKIKIKHLLSHASGLGNYFNKKFEESSRALFRSVNDMMTLVKGEKIAFEPGTSWQYSNTGFLVLGKIIEKVTGKSYYDYVRENIYKRAGMVHSDSYELDRVNPNLAVGYQKEFTDKGIQFRNNLFEHVIRGGPAGGGYSTVKDLLKFDIALRSHKLVGSKYVTLLLSPKPELHSPHYGYGFAIDQENGVVGHGGGFEGISANLSMNLDTGYTVAVLSNYSNIAQTVARKILELLGGATK